MCAIPSSIDHHRQRWLHRSLLWAVGTALAILAQAQGSSHAAPIEEGAVDRVLVEKAQRRLSLLAADGRVLRVYQGIQLGWQPVGPKHFAGDGRTPEGLYRIDRGNPDSAFHLSLHISYPDSADLAYAQLQRRAAGGEIFIHGSPNGMAARPQGDWTAGCIAVSDDEIEEIWSRVGDGAPIEIRP